MSNSALTVLVVLLAVVSLAALTFALLALRALRGRPTVSGPGQGAEPVAGLRHLAVVRYDAFGDMGGRLSWSLALLDDGGDGVVLTSIHGRSDARTYAKNVAAWSGEQQLSPEEEEAVTLARG